MVICRRLSRLFFFLGGVGVFWMVRGGMFMGLLCMDRFSCFFCFLCLEVWVGIGVFCTWGDLFLLVGFGFVKF